MKVCVIGPAHPLRGGIAHYNAQLALELAARHDVALISFSRQYPTLLFPGRTQHATSRPPAALAAEPLLDSLGPASWLRTGRRIAELTPDLIVAHWWNPFFGPCIGATLRVAKRRCRTPAVFLCHNVIPHERFPGARGLTRFALATGDGWLVHSETCRQDLESLRMEGRILTVPQPAARGYGAPLEKEEAKRRLGVSGNTLLFFGLVRRYKGLPRLIEALPLVLKRLDCTLFIVGEFYHDRGRCLNLITTLDLDAKVRVVDRFVPEEEVGVYFSAADLVVLPYVSATQSAVVPIAFAFGRPVLTTRVGGLPEAVEDGQTGLLVEPHDPAALADAVVRFYEQRLEEVFRRNILKREQFTWTGLTSVLEAFGSSAPQGNGV